MQPKSSTVYIVTPPQSTYAEAFASAASDYQETNEEKWIDLYTGIKDFPAYLTGLSNLEKGINMPAGRIPETNRWLISKKQEIIGFVRVRHRLNKELEEDGGHVSYDVPPSHRRNGYGHLCLKEAIGIANELGLRKVFLTCDSENLASKRIIEEAGAKLQDEVILRWKPYVVCRYWLQI